MLALVPDSDSSSMEEIKALDASAGRDILAILPPTIQIYRKHLSDPKNKARILAIPSLTESYGPHPRQKLDIYKAPQDSSSAPILLFFYGGGLARGDKISPQFNLVYANLGAFFASRGITTIIPDYRRVNNPSGGEDAVFPSGGEDVSLALKWVEKFDPTAKRNVFLLGNSAGGVHISTFLFEPGFFEQRKNYLAGEGSINLKGVIDIAVPFHFAQATPDRDIILNTYYGSKQGYEDHCAYGLLKTLVESGKSREAAAVPKHLVMIGQWDPVEEIVKPGNDFIELWKKYWGDLQVQTILGHNHISPPWALNAGEPAGEKWGEDVLEWIKGANSLRNSL